MNRTTTVALLLAQSADAGGGEGYLFWGAALFALALGLLVLELFFPTGGMAGILCAVAVIGSVVCFFRFDTTWGVLALVGYCVMAPFALVFGLKLWSHSPLARRMILGGTDPTMHMNEEEAMRAAEAERQSRLAELHELVGAVATVETILRPVGFVRINGRRVDAMSETGVIEPGATVEVIDVVDNQVKVRPIEAPR